MCPEFWVHIRLFKSCFVSFRSDFDELVCPGADADLLRVLQADGPVRVRMGGVEVVTGGAVAALVKQGGVGRGSLGQHGVGTGLVQSHRVEGGKHAHVRDDGDIVLRVAVAVGGHVHHQGHVEAGAAVYHGLGVLGDLLIQNSGRLVIQALDGILGAHRQAPGAAHALVRVDGGFAVGTELGRAVGADPGAGPAADAFSRAAAQLRLPML